MSHQELSADTEVVLLLCGRFGGERQKAFQPLSPREYGELAKWLNSRNLRPSDLLTDSGKAALAAVFEAKLERKRIDFLLGRGTALALALERWTRGGLWVISRGDAEFPKRLKLHLKHAAPPLFYGAGDKSLLELGGLAIIGSRDATEAALEFTRSIASKCAKERLNVVSGGARGVDAAAMQGVTEAGGYCIGVLASDLLKTSVNRQNRTGLQEGRLVLVSPFYPEAGFNAGNAMGRNRYIYALSDQALVIDSALRSGGTWEGAMENLEHGWVPLYVRTPGDGPGNAALVNQGGTPFTMTTDASETLSEFFMRSTTASEHAEGSSDETTHQAALALTEQLPASDASPAPPAVVETSDERVLAAAESPEAPTAAEEPPTLTAVPEMADQPSPATSGSALDMFADFTAKLLSLLSKGPLTEEDIAKVLCLEKSQVKTWLKRASESGDVEKLKRPVRYARGGQTKLC